MFACILFAQAAVPLRFAGRVKRTFLLTLMARLYRLPCIYVRHLATAVHSLNQEQTTVYPHHALELMPYTYRLTYSCTV